VTTILAANLKKEHKVLCSLIHRSLLVVGNSEAAKTITHLRRLWQIGTKGCSWKKCLMKANNGI
jgi:hypothetical protein